jgi:hypothetical protein
MLHDWHDAVCLNEQYFANHLLHAQPNDAEHRKQQSCVRGHTVFWSTRQQRT